MFSHDFFPTPPAIIDLMIQGEDLSGKNVWEPEAGKGDIVKRCQASGANVFACENHPDLLKIIQNTCSVIAADMLTVTAEQVSHIDLVVMNPPFSTQVEHILHAYKVMPAGCKLISLCNIQSLKNPYSEKRKEFVSLVETYGSYIDIGKSFEDAERRTSVDVALVRLEKSNNNYEAEFNGFFMDEEPEENNGPGLMPYNAIRDIVNRYVGAVKVFDRQAQTAIDMEALTGSWTSLQVEDDRGRAGKILAFTMTADGAPIHRNEFKKYLQKKAWLYIFKKLNLEKLATKGLREDINKFVETQQNVPFTMRNIYHMLDLIMQTTSQRMDKAMEEIFDNVTKHHHENRQNLTGWKTNSHFLLTRRFIVPNGDIIPDLLKVLCYMTGTDYDTQLSFERRTDRNIHVLMEDGKTIVRDPDYDFPIPLYWQDYQIKNGYHTETVKKYPGAKLVPMEWEYGKWFDWGFFRVRIYKKGTRHFEFKDEKVWAEFNQRIARIKGYPLAEKKEQTAYQKRQTYYKDAPAPKVKPTVLTTIKL